MSMGVHHPYPLDLCAYDEDPSQLIIRPGWDAPHVRCSPRTFCAWPCLLRQVGTVLGSPYANPRSRQGAPIDHPGDESPECRDAPIHSLHVLDSFWGQHFLDRLDLVR